MNVTLKARRIYNYSSLLALRALIRFFSIACISVLIRLFLFNYIALRHFYYASSLRVNQTLDFDQFDEQACYYTCLRKIFKVSYLKGKNNKRSAPLLMPYILLCILI